MSAICYLHVIFFLFACACLGATWSEEEPAADIRGLESGVCEQVGQRVSLSGSLCARLVPRHHAGTSNIYSAGAQQLVSVCSAC